MSNANFPEFLTARLTVSDMAILQRLVRAYGLRSRSEAVRRALRQAAADRGLLEE